MTELEEYIKEKNEEEIESNKRLVENVDNMKQFIPIAIIKFFMFIIITGSALIRIVAILLPTFILFGLPILKPLLCIALTMLIAMYYMTFSNCKILQKIK